MDRLIEISALLAGGAVFVTLAVLSWALDRPKRGSGKGERFIPGNYHPHAHHADDGFGHHS
ncbi:MAG: hypothetical protein NW206_12135 [Hyphomonadaceae bacterium]|nr:hypothetical protein [Hyphomonadaceae bacterium]